ncbi:MAG: SH3 domain-containing protein [Pseudomonadota bacterium]|nr:SH3 domain-containing protein [Pseudomonadota bacterium]
MKLAGWLMLLSLLAAGSAFAADNTPRHEYASFHSDKVNMRTGPGFRYPVEWVYQRRSMPVRIIERFDTWRKIRDWQGTEGWVHHSMITSDRNKRTMIVTGSNRTIHQRPGAGSLTVAVAEPGVIGRIVSCRANWCRVSIQNFEGWMRRSHFWGTAANEDFD